MLKPAVVAFLTYCLVAQIAFGDILAPLAFATFWSDRLGVPLWRVIALSCTFLSAGIFLFPKRQLPSVSLRLSIFVGLAMITSIGTVGIYADQLRRDRIAVFAADETIEHSFFRSIREAPQEYQFYLHSAALKDCIPYAWSYRSMAFYRIPRDAAVNVLPRSWVTRCSI